MKVDDWIKSAEAQMPPEVTGSLTLMANDFSIKLNFFTRGIKIIYTAMWCFP